MSPEEQAARIAALEAQVAALKEIAVEERAAMLACAEDSHGIDEGHLIEARRQLAEEHPDRARWGGVVIDATCQLRFIARAVSGGLLDDRCQQEGCAMWSGARKCCGLIKEATQ